MTQQEPSPAPPVVPAVTTTAQSTAAHVEAASESVLLHHLQGYSQLGLEYGLQDAFVEQAQRFAHVGILGAVVLIPDDQRDRMQRIHDQLAQLVGPVELLDLGDQVLHLGGLELLC